MHQTARRLRVAALLFIVVSPVGLSAQNHANHDHQQERSEHLHEDALNELGLGNYLAYLAGEKEFAYSLHIHYQRSFKESRFGAGIGYEQIFDEHRHRSLAFVGTYRAASRLILSLAPGMLFGTQENPGISFTLHTELGFEFELGDFHLGPALEFATTFKEYHLSAGVHFSFAF